MKKKSVMICLAVMLVAVGSLSLAAYTAEPAIGKAKEYLLSIGDDETEEYVLTFDENGGEDLVDIAAAEGTVITLPTCERIGYDFVSWVTSGGTEYKVGDEFTLTADTTLTAKWEESDDIVYGDVNGDGKITTKDKIALARYLSKWDDYTEDTIDLSAADVNGDGNVTTKDKIILARYLSKWDGYTELPYTGE